MQITILPPDHSVGKRALEIAGNTEEVWPGFRSPAIEVERFECPDIECGAVFSYVRVSCGHFVPPTFCPTCGGPMDGNDSDDGSVPRLITQAYQSRRGLILP